MFRLMIIKVLYSKVPEAVYLQPHLNAVSLIICDWGPVAGKDTLNLDVHINVIINILLPTSIPPRERKPCFLPPDQANKSLEI